MPENVACVRVARGGEIVIDPPQITLSSIQWMIDFSTWLTLFMVKLQQWHNFGKAHGAIGETCSN